MRLITKASQKQTWLLDKHLSKNYINLDFFSKPYLQQKKRGANADDRVSFHFLQTLTFQKIFAPATFFSTDLKTLVGNQDNENRFSP